MFAYGSVGLILAMFLSQSGGLGFDDTQIGTMLALTLFGDAAISFVITMYADRLGKRLMLLIGSALMAMSGVIFATTDGPKFWLLLFAATAGVISPSGNEVGPFMALEQSIISELLSPQTRTSIFALYNLVGYVSTALGSLLAGIGMTYLMGNGYDLSQLDAYRCVFVEYAAIATLLLLMFLLLSGRIEAQHHQAAAAAAKAAAAAAAAQEADEEATAPLLQPGEGEESEAAVAPPPVGLSGKSLKLVITLSTLFSVDSLAGGLITNTLLAYYLKVTYDTDTAYIGQILFVSNIIAGFSSLLSGWVASKCGLINTMVFTHLPSSIFVILIPLMPSLEWVTVMLYLRFSLSQGLFRYAFFMCGGLKIAYDIALLISFGKFKLEN
ncbi:MAG: hypothetical protein WDW38_001228 [Sanguina aurantia]